MAIDEQTAERHFEAQGRLSRLNNYYRWILNNFGIRFEGRRIWDAGAGVGHVSALLVSQAEFLLATEFTEQNIDLLRSRLADRPNVQVRYCDLLAPPADELQALHLDTIVNLDVLEHLEDDGAALKTFFDILEPGGYLLLKVPAHPLLFGTMDEASLHFRRYEKGGLRDRLSAAGFSVERLRYMNMAAVIPYLIKGRVLKLKGNFSMEISQERLELYNNLIPWFERFERAVKPAFGLSLIAVARKPA